MRVFKSIISITVITTIALLYVHQQVELVKLSYAIENKEKRLKDMLDHRESVVYNIDNLEAPSRLEQVLLAQKVEVAFPKKRQVVKAHKMISDARGVEQLHAASIERKSGLDKIMEFLSPRAEAQAKEK